jgi:hypothetical protein
VFYRYAIQLLHAAASGVKLSTAIHAHSRVTPTMPIKKYQFLCQLHEDIANEISELTESDEIDAWLDDQELPLAAYAKDLDALVQLFERELATRGYSMKIH